MGLLLRKYFVSTGPIFLCPPESEALPARRGRPAHESDPRDPAGLPLFFSTLKVDANSAVPLNRQLFEAIREGIRSGELPERTKLPTISMLTAVSGLARNTVIAAYKRLAIEGFVESHVGRGTHVAPGLLTNDAQPLPASETIDPTTLAEGAVDLTGMANWPSLRPGPFALRAVSPSLFPLSTLGRFLAEETRSLTAADSTEETPGGHPRLRRAIAGMLRQVRGVSCTENQVIVTASAMTAFDLVVRLMVRPGDRAAMADPCYEFPTRQMNERSAIFVSLPSDEEGSMVPVETRTAAPRFAYVSTECDPITGARMSEARREALIAWSVRTGSFIVENDWDWPFLFDKPLSRSIQGRQKTSDNVFYVGSFFQSISPSLRVGYVVVPRHLAASFAMAAAPTRLGQGPPNFTQLALARFIDGGHFLSHVRRLRSIYSQRRQIMIDACRQHIRFGTLETGHGGLHVTVRLPSETWDDDAVAQEAGRAGVNVGAMSQLCHSAHPLCGLMLGYASVPNAQIEPAVKRLARVVDSIARGG